MATSEDNTPLKRPGSLELISWNVNGLRAVLRKGSLQDFFATQNADIVCLQETKIQEHQVPKLEIPFPHQFYHSAEKPGYSSTAILSKVAPIAVSTDFPPVTSHPQEGRVQAAEFDSFYLVNVYVPNSQNELRRLPYRTEIFDREFRVFLQRLAKTKPVVVCGDFNVAHQEIDIARPKDNRRNAGFTDEERAEFTDHLGAGFLDSFRHLHPDTRDIYSWWSMRGGARERNVGWRIDYFLISESLGPRLEEAFIMPEVMGSDHCPVGIVLKGS